MISKRIVKALGAVLIATLWSTSAFAERTDIVVLINGDEVTGEVEGLDFGALSYSTDSMGTVKIDWEEIVSITSNQHLQVEISNGLRYHGTLVLAGDTDHIAVVRPGGVQELQKTDVIRMTPIETEERFIDRLEGSVSFGFNTGKSSGVTQGNLNADIRYRTRDYLVGLTSNSTVTETEGEEETRRANLSVNYQRFKENRWFTDWSATYETNEELGIQNRFSIGGGLGRYFVQNNKNQFSLLLGVVATTETFTDDNEGTTNGEGKISARYLRRVLSPSTDITFRGDVFPLLGDLSVFRSEMDLSLRREFIDDLYFDLSVFHSYQTDPPDGAEKEDYGVITSLGYSF